MNFKEQLGCYSWILSLKMDNTVFDRTVMPGNTCMLPSHHLALPFLVKRIDAAFGLTHRRRQDL